MTIKNSKAASKDIHAAETQRRAKLAVSFPDGSRRCMELLFAAAQGSAHQQQQFLTRLAHELEFIASSARCSSMSQLEAALCAYVLCPHLARVLPDRPQIAAVAMGPGSGLELPQLWSSTHGLRVEHSSFGQVVIVFEEAGVGIYLLEIAPGAGIAPHVHQLLDEYELVLSDGLLVQGQGVSSGISHHWPHGFPHRYDNPSERSQVVLCVDHPAFIPADEQLVHHPRLLPPLKSHHCRRWWG